MSGSLYYNSGFDIAPGGFFTHVGAFSTLALSTTYHFNDERAYVRLWADNVTGEKYPVYIGPGPVAFQVTRTRPRSYGIVLGFKH